MHLAFRVGNSGHTRRMSPFSALRFAVVYLSLTLLAVAAHPFLCCDHNGGKVCVVSAEGAIEWEYPLKNPQDCWVLPNGNYLFAYVNGAVEVTKEKSVAWFHDCTNRASSKAETKLTRVRCPRLIRAATEQAAALPDLRDRSRRSKS